MDSREQDEEGQPVLSGMLPFDKVHTHRVPEKGWNPCELGDVGFALRDVRVLRAEKAPVP